VIVRALALGVALVVVSGCSTTNVSELVKAMAGDSATVCVTAQWGGGLVNASRTNIVNGDVVCNGNGLSVKSTPGVVSLPVTVTPTQVKP
jgi:hypothetical protein